MNDLLDSAVAAHGGLDRWNQVKSITVDASITGALWSLKSKGDTLKDVRFEVDTTRERLTMDFAWPPWPVTLAADSDPEQAYCRLPRMHGCSTSGQLTSRDFGSPPPRTGHSASHIEARLQPERKAQT